VQTILAPADTTRGREVTLVSPTVDIGVAKSSNDQTIIGATDASQNRQVTLLGPTVKISSGGTESSVPESLEGVSVPGYDILQELGRGGMGVVYKARHQKLQRLVALKMILAGAHAGASGLARFRAEAEAVAQLQHANIVQVYEIGEHDGCPYFSLELVEGGILDQRLRELPPPPKGAAYLMESLARAMGFAHQHGIIHRDLKPANILLAASSGKSSVIRKEQLSGTSSSSIGDHWSRTATPKITDFGLAKRVDDNAAGQTHTGTILGTPSYMSPEQASGKVREIGRASDIYSLGAILYEMLTGRPPFKAANPIDVIHQVIDQEPVPPRSIEPRVPLDLETICLKCLQKEPARRYDTAEALADDLHRFLVHEPILSRPISTWERAVKWAKRRPATVALLAVSVAAIFSMVLFIVWHNVSLRDRLNEALADERSARQREADAVEEQRVSQVQSEAQKLFDSARVAAAASEWPTARLDLTKALTIIRREPRLDALQKPAEALLTQVENELKQVDERLRVEAEQRASQVRFEKFGSLRDEAQFLGSLHTGMDLAANLKASRAAVHQALAVCDVPIRDALEGEAPAEPSAVPIDGSAGSSPSRILLDSNLSDAQRAEVRGDCYQLFLILAETESQTASDQNPAEQEAQLREALRLLDQALRFGTPSRAYHLRCARYLSRLGDDTATTAAERAAQAAPVADVLDHFLMADELYRRAELDEAIREFEHVLQTKPDHFWAQYLNGLCLLRLNRHAEAKTMLTACLAQGREFVWLYLLRGFAHGELKAWDAAESDFRKALQLPLDDNSRYVLFVNRGVLRIKQERFDDAIADLTQATKLNPTKYQAFVNLAQAHRRLNDLDAALQQLDFAVEREPTLAHLYRLRARLRQERNEPEMALADFDPAIRRDDAGSPFHVDNLVERGRLLLRTGKHEQSLASFDAAVKIRSDHSLAQRLRAEALFHLDRFQEVIEAFDRYLETGKPLESVYRGRGLAKSELGKYPGAIEDFTKSLELQPTSAVQAYRGWMHVVVDAHKLAERVFQSAIELDPTNADAFCGRGFVHAISKQPREAIADAEEALRLGPKAPRLLYNAARIYAQSERASDVESKAFELISEALASFPEERRAAFWNSQVRTDAALESIRKHPRFLQMEREVLLKR
jgi:serine/threonine protein kinase/Tfp pilus assembly protein PilF